MPISAFFARSSWSGRSGSGTRCSAGVFCLAMFFALLVGLPALKAAYPSPSLARFDSIYRAGALVLGGGHVVVPLLRSEVVPPGWVSNDAFLAGYGAAQAVPGPLFTFSAYLGAIMTTGPNGWQGALLCLAAIFLPAFLLVIGVLPFWDDLRQFRAVRSALTGVNAAVARTAARCALRPGMDQRHIAAVGFRARAGRIRAPRILEMSAVAGRDGQRARRVGTRKVGASRRRVSAPARRGHALGIKVSGADLPRSSAWAAAMANRFPGHASSAPRTPPRSLHRSSHRQHA